MPPNPHTNFLANRQQSASGAADASYNLSLIAAECHHFERRTFVAPIPLDADYGVIPESMGALTHEFAITPAVHLLGDQSDTNCHAIRTGELETRQTRCRGATEGNPGTLVRPALFHILAFVQTRKPFNLEP